MSGIKWKRLPLREGLYFRGLKSFNITYPRPPQPAIAPNKNTLVLINGDQVCFKVSFAQGRGTSGGRKFVSENILCESYIFFSQFKFLVVGANNAIYIIYKNIYSHKFPQNGNTAQIGVTWQTIESYHTFFAQF